MFVTNNLKYGAPAIDGLVGIGIALGMEAIDNCFTKLPCKPLASLVPLKRRRIPATCCVLLAPVAPQYETNLRLAPNLPSPRNTMSRSPIEVQAHIFEAAQAKRARKQQARIIAAGGSISEEL